MQMIAVNMNCRRKKNKVFKFCSVSEKDIEKRANLWICSFCMREHSTFSKRVSKEKTECINCINLTYIKLFVTIVKDYVIIL